MICVSVHKVDVKRPKIAPHLPNLICLLMMPKCMQTDNPNLLQCVDGNDVTNFTFLAHQVNAFQFINIGSFDFDMTLGIPKPNNCSFSFSNVVFRLWFWVVLETIQLGECIYRLRLLAFLQDFPICVVSVSVVYDFRLSWLL